MVDSHSEEAKIEREATQTRLLERLRELHLISSPSQSHSLPSDPTSNRFGFGFQTRFVISSILLF